MNNVLIAVSILCFFSWGFFSCSGKKLSQAQMDQRIELLTEAGKDSLEAMLDSACDAKFSTLVTTYRDSLLAVQSESE